MKSALPKVLHPIAGLPLVAHVVKAAEAAGATDLALVIGHGADEMRKAAAKFAPGAGTFVQEPRLGTAHAVLAARDAVAKGYDDILVMFGDTPLIDAAALGEARAKLAAGAAVVVIGFRPPSPAGYGRLIEKAGKLVAIREEKDCTDEERKIGFCNAGMMAVSGRHALELLDAVGNANAKGEYYLTDIVEIAGAKGLDVVATEAGFENALGINNRAELAEAEAIWQKRRRQQAMLSGVTLIAPETVYFSHDTELGPDTVVEPNVVFGPGVKIAGGVKIHAFSHIEGATAATGADIGPFARLRPGADLAAKAKVGNFVEVKNARIEAGAKVNHLTYIGDARIGAGANIGAGTITCNYDGFQKHPTTIGNGVFIGSDSVLVAPVRVGDAAYVAAGSTVTENVPPGGLAIARGRQVNKPGWATRKRRELAARHKPGKRPARKSHKPRPRKKARKR